MKESRSCLEKLQVDVPDPCAVSLTTVDLRKLLAQAEVHQATLEVQQQALASLEHRMEHLLISSNSQEPPSPSPAEETLAQIQESIMRCESFHIYEVIPLESP